MTERTSVTGARRNIAAAIVVTLALAVSTSPAAAQQTAAAPTAAARSLFVVTYRPGPAWVAGKPMHQQKLGSHAEYIRALLDRGNLFAGGPFTDGDGGMAILWAAGLDDAKAILAADPAITEGVFAAELRPWRPRFDANRPLTP